MKKKVLTGMALGLALTAAAPMSVMAGEGTANVAVVSDYVWRGVTQTNNGAALQGGYDYDFGNDFSAGVWASNVADGLEYDLYGSYAGTAGDMGYSLGFIYYGFTDAANTAGTETVVGVSYKDVSLDYYIGDGTDYMDLNYGTEVGGMDLGVNYGSTTGYTTYGVSVGKDVSGVGVGLTFASATAATVTTTAFALSVSKEF
ncbi:MAG: TorF family putative porin [Gammaproteobacteria bacterium]|nr:TorF family putative porin [Gammaproteobacteria bacterium]